MSVVTIVSGPRRGWKSVSTWIGAVIVAIATICAVFAPLLVPHDPFAQDLSKRLLVPFPFWLAKLQAMALQFLPVPLLTPDQVDMLRVDNVVSESAKTDGRTLQGLGITPETMEAILPAYLWRFRKTGQYGARMA